MGFDRFGAKLSARESLRVNRPSPILATLIHLLLTTGLAFVVALLTVGPLIDLYQYIAMGYPAEEALTYVLRDQGPSLAIFVLVWLLLSLYNTFMSFGYTSYTLRVARNEQPRFGHLFDGFARPLRVFGANLLMGLFTALWVLAVLLPLTGILLLGHIAWEDSYYILSNVSSAVSVVVSYRYSLTLYFIIDDPDCTARQAIRRSKTAMRGWKWTLFALDLSFLGWALLAALLGTVLGVLAFFVGLTFSAPAALIAMMIAIFLGILPISLWVTPYQSAARANFYDWLTGAVEPGGSPAGPDYDYHANDGPQPF